jgi:hypothetical protein
VRCDSYVHWQLAINISEELFFPFSGHKIKPLKEKKCTTQVKVKAIPLESWTGPEGSRKLRLSDFKIIGT